MTYQEGLRFLQAALRQGQARPVIQVGAATISAEMYHPEVNTDFYGNPDPTPPHPFYTVELRGQVAFTSMYQGETLQFLLLCE